MKPSPLLFLATLAACGSTPPPNQTTPTMSPSSSTTTGPSSTSTTPTVGTTTPTVARPPTPVSTRPTDGVVFQRCDAMAKAYTAAMQKGARGADALKQVLGAPPSTMDADDVAFCRTNYARIINNDLAEDAARITLLKIATALKTTFDTKHTLCPGAHAVPPQPIDEADIYSSKDADFAGEPGWSCASYRATEPMRMQLELKVDPKTQSFVVYARHIVDRKVVELSLGGAVKGRVVEIAPQINEQRTPLP